MKVTQELPFLKVEISQVVPINIEIFRRNVFFNCSFHWIKLAYNAYKPYLSSQKRCMIKVLLIFIFFNVLIFRFIPSCKYNIFFSFARKIEQKSPPFCKAGYYLSFYKSYKTSLSISFSISQFSNSKFPETILLYFDFQF